jgi:hypothetical protein
MARSLRRSLFLVVPAALAALALTVPASARPDGNTSATGATAPALLALIGNDDLFSTMDLSAALTPTGAVPTQHYGPFASTSGDSSTCGPDWATDNFDRHFTVRSNGGTFTIVEQFKDGNFVTSAGPSPAACDPTYMNHGLLVDGGVTGSMHGYFIISNVVGPQTSTSPFCNATTSSNVNCDTTTFINTHFAPCYPSVCTVGTFFFHYAAGDQSLLYHEWKNASADRGGNGGDIASS